MTLWQRMRPKEIYTGLSDSLSKLLGYDASEDRHLITFSIIAALISLFLFLSGDKELAKFIAYIIGGVLIIFLTNRRAKAMEKNVRLSEKGQSIERFKSAVKLLGEHESVTSVGAVYALHRMAQDEPKVCESAFDVLCEYIRQAEKGDVATQIALKLIFGTDGADHYNVASREANLSGACLANRDLSNLTLIASDLSNADLSNANIRGTGFTESNLTEAEIRNVQADSSTIMRKAVLKGIKVSSADLSDIDFSEADFRPSDVVSSFKHVDFSNCDFNNARMDGASFDSSNFKGAKNLTKEQILSTQSPNGIRGLPDSLR